MQLLCFAFIVFSENTQLFKTHLVKPIFHPCQKTPFSKKYHFWFWAISVETTIFIVFPGNLVYTVLVQKILAKTDSAHENAPFSPFLTQIVSGSFCYKSIFCFFTFLDDHQKTLFLRGLLAFSILSVFFCFYFSNIKNAIFFSKTSFLTSRQFCKKNYFGTKWHYLCL